jgi:tRNA threonylcarbamoyladenosine biosynthesis protein TsaE
MLDLATEAELAAAAGRIAQNWRASGLNALSVGLRGPLGSGKTTWVRAMLRGLGYTGRVPSPTYTLLEEYRLDALTIVHLDLYRIAAAGEIEFLGLRERFGEPGAWLFVEWPERVPSLLERCDLVLDFAPVEATRRRVTFAARSASGQKALAGIPEPGFK